MVLAGQRNADGAADVVALCGIDVIVRIEPGNIRAWGYAGRFGTG
jgi:hypothetical protein